MIELQENPVASHITKVRYCICYLAITAILLLLFIGLATSSCMGGCFGNTTYSRACTANDIRYCCKDKPSFDLALSCGKYSDC